MRYISICIIIAAFTMCSGKTQSDQVVRAFSKGIKIAHPDSLVSFRKLKKTYETLIPVFHKFFITNNGKKWGVVDSSGKTIIPFICDGITSISDTEGIASLYSNSQSLHTGVPRYEYFGKYFFFGKNGRTEKKEQVFELLVEMRSDFHHEKYIVESGPYYYLPDVKGDTIQERSLRWGRPVLNDSRWSAPVLKDK